MIEISRARLKEFVEEAASGIIHDLQKSSDPEPSQDVIYSELRRRHPKLVDAYEKVETTGSILEMAVRIDRKMD